MLKELFYACIKGDVAKLEQILQAHPELDLNTPVHWEAAPNFPAFSALQLAICSPFNIPVLRELMDNPDIAEEDKNLIIDAFIRNPKKELFPLLKKNNIEIDLENIEETGDHFTLPFIDQLINGPYKVNINYVVSGNFTALYFAVLCKYSEAVQLLLKNINIDPNIADLNNITPLYVALENKADVIAKILIENPRVDIFKSDICQKSPLRVVARHGNVEIADMLLKRGAKINQRDQLGFSALTIAAQKGHDEFVRLLLKNEKINPNILNTTQNLTPLMYGLELPKSKFNCILSVFLENKQTDLNIRTAQRELLLHFLIRNKYTNAAIALIHDDRTNINAPNNQAEVPLLMAAKKNNERIFKALLAHPKIYIPSKKSQAYKTLYLQIQVANLTFASLLEEKCNAPSPSPTRNPTPK